jgi:hypothetical protein
VGEIGEIDGDAEQRETCDQHAGDGTGLEGELETAGERGGRGLRRAHVGADGDVHADEAGRARQDRADRKPDRNQRAEEISQQPEDDDADEADRGVLAPQIGLRALAHRGRDFLHPWIAGVRFQNGSRRPDGVNDGKRSAEHNHP